MEDEVFPWVANPEGEELADHQTRQDGSIFCHFQWPRPGISEGNTLYLAMGFIVQKIKEPGLCPEL